MNSEQLKLIKLAESDLMDAIRNFDDASKYVINEMTDKEYENMDDFGVIALISVPQDNHCYSFHQVAIGDRDKLLEMIKDSKDFKQRIMNNKDFRRN